ncbi:hypothetical protein HID58_060014 [Brassica napus]|uniref:Uncharacterized protein n=1 Tax=Brassica napus TaxID=3708 RepID=A0ABQ7ZUT0_BRANA|nr:hypothetical protein HID58_060014 [Brassica napus]
MDALTSQLHEEKDKVLAREKEIRDLQFKVKNQEDAGVLAASENVALRGQLEELIEEHCGLKHAEETFDAEKAMAVNGAKVVARRELMREWLNQQTDKWNSAVEFERYKEVKTSEAQLQGLSPPSFDGEPSFPGDDAATVVSAPTPTGDPGASPSA